MLPKLDLEGIGITAAPPEAIVEEAARWIRERSDARTLAAVNVHTFMEARRSPAFRDALNDASIAWVDGVPIRWLLSALRGEAPHRIHGADLAALFMERLPQARHLFFGSTEDTLGRLSRALAHRYPGLRTAGFIAPPFRNAAGPESAEMVGRINASGADILWVALGAPKQELWAALNRRRIRVPVIACVGAAFEIFSGRFGRAPRQLQRMGLEWAWRMAQDPVRLWRRYFAANGAFLTSHAGALARNLFRP